MKRLLIIFMTMILFGILSAFEAEAQSVSTESIYIHSMDDTLYYSPLITRDIEQLDAPKKNKVVLGNQAISREESDLVVWYDISLGENVRSCNIEVTLEIVGGSKVTLDPLKLNGDYGKIIESGSKKITYDIDEDLYDKEVFATLTVKQKNVLDNEILTMASMTSMPQYSYGLMLGSVKKFGGYAKLRSDFNSGEYSYICNSAGEVVGDGYMWASGSQRKYRMQATAGVIFRLSKWCYPYLGTGYGIRSVHWQDYNGQWAQVSDYSCKGIAAEGGLIIKMGPVAVSAGVSTTAFRYTELEIGIGLML